MDVHATPQIEVRRADSECGILGGGTGSPLQCPSTPVLTTYGTHTHTHTHTHNHFWPFLPEPPG